MLAEPEVVTRLREFKAGVLQSEAAQMRLMAKRWLQVEDALEAQISALVQEMAALSRAGKPVGLGKVYRLERYRKLLAQAQGEFGKYAEWADGLIASGQTQMALLGVEHAVEVLGLMQVGYAFDRLNADAVSNMIGFTGDGQPLGELLRLRMVKDATGLPLPGVSERLAQTLVNATAQGWNPRKTAKMIQSDLAGGLNKALQITRTEQIRAYRQASADQYRASGIVTGIQRLCAHNERTCIACLADEGHVYPMDQGLPDHVQGRCTGVPVIRGQAPLKYQTGEAWFDTQDAATQRDIMGPGRYQKWQKGEVQFKEFAQTTHSETWGAGLGVTPLRALGG